MFKLHSTNELSQYENFNTLLHFKKRFRSNWKPQAMVVSTGDPVTLWNNRVLIFGKPWRVEIGVSGTTSRKDIKFTSSREWHYSILVMLQVIYIYVCIAPLGNLYIVCMAFCICKSEISVFLVSMQYINYYGSYRS